MSIEELTERHHAAKREVNNLRERLHERHSQLLDTDVASYARSTGRSSINLNSGELVCCRTLQGHTGKVYSLDWSQKINRIVSASQDGRLIVWNALTGQKIYAIKPPSAWVIACAFAPSGHTIVCGGLDNVCSIFALNSPQERDGNLPVSRTLTGHKGCISCCRYAPGDDLHLITSSGDGTCALWDTETCQRIAVFGGDSFSGHNENVLSLSFSPVNSHEFVSGSINKIASLWDTRIASRAVHKFYGHLGDVTTVSFFPDGLRVGTGSDDTACRIFDTRTGHQLQLYGEAQAQTRGASVTSITFSYSGRLLFSAYENEDCYAWDTITAEVVFNFGVQSNAHRKRINCLGLSYDGSALCTGSSDTSLKVWAFDRQKII